MDKRKREIIALVLLVLLGIVVASAMAWYILVGHNWNKAASHIDDFVGSMDGYTVIVYEGVVPQPKEKKSSASAASKASSLKSTTSASASASASESTPSVTSTSASASASSSGPSSASDLSSASASAIMPSETSKASTSSVSASSGSASKGTRAIKVSLKKVVKSYRDKGASVVTLRLNDAKRYEDPFVVSKGGKRVGITTFQGKYRYAPVRAKSALLKKAEADTTVLIADDASFKKGLLRDIDIVVLARDARINQDGRFYGSTFFVDSPYVGEVQAVIISPSGTIISKTITSL